MADKEDDYEVARPGKKGLSGLGKAGVAAALIGGVGVIGYPIIFPEGSASFETSQTQEFQEDGSGSSFARVEPGETEPREEATFDIGPINDQLAEQREALEARNAELESRVKQLQSELGTISEQATEEQNVIAQQLADALSQAQNQNAEALEQVREEFETKLTETEAENQQAQERQQALLESLETQNNELATMLARQADAGQEAALEQQRLEAERQAEERRRQELAQRRAEAAALMKARVQSPSVVFDNGSVSQTGGGQEVAAPGQRSREQSAAERNRNFVESGAAPVEVTQSEFIANPANTVLQGTMISATLENAVDSSLPGSVTAMINSPVYSFDGSALLIPSGSRVFGSYSSEVALGQGRILVRWTRIVTPEGQSVQMAAYGGDQQGRSGITGKVNSRFGMRFGSAALISLIGAAPAIAVSSTDNASELERDTAEAVGEDLSNATDSVISEYASLPPIISVEQGAQVTIMVDRDLEFF